MTHGGSPAPSNFINGRHYESPATSDIRDQSANITYGGCFNANSTNMYTPVRKMEHPLGSRCPSPAYKHRISSSFRQNSGYGNLLPKWRTSTPINASAHLSHLNQRPRLVDLECNDSFASPNGFSSTINSGSTARTYKCSLPVWASDGEGGVTDSVTLLDVLTNDAILDFATDKNGCRFLQEHYPAESHDELHQKIFRKMVEDCSVFLSLCLNMFGNFFVQRVLEFSSSEEQEVLTEHLSSKMFSLCMDKSACRVIQLAIQKLDAHLATRLVSELRDTDLVCLSIDQNGNHVIQKIIKTLPVSAWEFTVDFFCDHSNLISVCQDKYGCRVIQSTVEALSSEERDDSYQRRMHLLRRLMTGITHNCSQLASNEFANYVVQHVIKCGESMAVYRDAIIEKCLLQNLLSMSQEKYASHVVEVAFCSAPFRLVVQMMEEIFEGYIPHPETNRDALDILLFHQYGNYVIQQMIQICILGQSLHCPDQKQKELFSTWLEKIRERVMRNAYRLERFSSGKKILEALQSSPCLQDID